MKDYKAYLFDLDGTLVNSEPLKGQAIANACKDCGFPVDYHIYKQVMGQHWSVVTAHFFREAGFNPEPKAFDLLFKSHYEQLLASQLALNPGAFDYLQHIKNTGKANALVSSGARWMVHHILQSLQLEGWFDVVIAREDVSRHKPDPQGYLSALAQLDMSAKDAVIFEDSDAGIQAGVACGCDVVAFEHEFNLHNDLTQAMKVISDYHQML